ncbi:hypothetical protein [Leptolyngbya sp. KIOST-1]|nr:hypothetical protein [Leptolyngbya sp. KIOST-1]
MPWLPHLDLLQHRIHRSGKTGSDGQRTGYRESVEWAFFDGIS